MADELERIPEDLRSDLSVAAVDLLLRENARLKARVEQRDKQIAVFNSGGFTDADALAEKFADLQAKLEEKERGLEVKNQGLISMTTGCSNLRTELQRLRIENAEYRAALEKISAVTPCAGTYEQDVHQRVLAALEHGRKATKHITEKEAEIGDGSERNFRLDAK